MENQEIIQKLNSAYFIKSKISHYPVCHSIIPQPDGLSVVIFDNKEDIDEYFKSREVEDIKDFDFERVNSIYDRMTEFANMGFVGFWFYKNFPIFFANRLSEYNCELPTIGIFPNSTFETQTYFGASGILPEMIGIKVWSNFYKTDKILRRNYESYFTNLSKFCTKFFAVFDSRFLNKQRIIRESPLHGPYSSPDGAIPVFSSLENTQEYVDQFDHQDKSELSIKELENLNSYLNETKNAEDMGFLYDICLNPFSSRFEQGYFFECESKWYFKNIYNTYSVQDNLLIELEDEDIVTPGKSDAVPLSSQLDSIEAKLKTTVKFPLKRILRNTNSRLSFREANEVVQKEINTSLFAAKEGWDKEIEPNQIGRDSYLVFGFDKISGNPFSNNGLNHTPYIFSDIFEACSFFYHKLLPFDCEIRIDGYATHSYVKEKSEDPDYEKNIFEETRLGLIQLMEDILVQGYKPSFSNYLKKYINETSTVLEIEECGYVDDLSFYENNYITEFLDEKEEEYTEEVDDEIDNDEELNNEKTLGLKIIKLLRSKKSRPELDYQIQQKIKRSLGKSEVNLDDESRMMLETAILDFKEKGISNTVDYAPISMELCKVFERELKRNVFEKWKADSKLKKDEILKLLQEYPNNQTISKLCNWVIGRGTIELGNMKFILKESNSGSTIWIFQNLFSFINKLPSADYLLSDEFQSTIGRISSVYRNGGVHEHLVSYSICEKAFNEILTGPGNALKKLLEP